MNTEKNSLRKDQKGFAALLIAMVLILVLGLLTVGFAELMRKETRSALDKQLSSQAYYAAESGINDAATEIHTNPNIRKKTCAPDAKFPSNKVGDKTNASYPCLLINPTPPDLMYEVKTTESKVTELQGVDADGNPKAIGSMLISWEDKGGGSGFAPANNCNGNTSGTFLPANGGSPSWTYAGMLRTQLIPINDVSRNGLTANSYTAFMCPQSGTGASTNSIYDENKGTLGGGVVSGNCKNGTKPRQCNVKITNLGSLNQNTFFLSMRSIYAAVNVTIKIYGADVAQTQLNIAQAQVLVDSTGKAQDVLKRIQARIPAHNGYAIPDDGAKAMADICKQLQVIPASAGGSLRGGSSDCATP